MLGRAGLGIACGLVMLFLIFPVFIIVPISFSTAGGVEFPPPSYSFARYIAFFHAADWLEATWLSARIALLATLLATPIGLGLALGLVRGRFRGKSLLHGLLLAPLIVPTIIYALALFFFYRQVNLFDRALG